MREEEISVSSEEGMSVSGEEEMPVSSEHENPAFRSGFVTIAGRPNVGKSTLMNHFIGQKVAITSNKPQTTRNRIMSVYTKSGRGQIVFVDTPGIIQARNKLGEYMVRVTKSAIRDVDLILWLIEPDEEPGAGDKRIAEQLKKADIPVVLVINKIDMKPKETLLPVIDHHKDLMDFAEIVPVSAREGDGLDELLDVVFSYLPYGPMYFDEDTVTDQPERALVAEFIREKALHALSQEVPHGIAVSVDQMKKRKKKRLYDIDATIICEKESHKGIIIGKGGQMLKKIGTNARFEIERMLDSKVNLSLFVRVKKDWRDSDYLVANFGYRDEDEGGM